MNQGLLQLILRHPDAIAVFLIALTLAARPVQSCCLQQLTGIF
jgi:hypothetical protein